MMVLLVKIQVSVPYVLEWISDKSNRCKGTAKNGTAEHNPGPGPQVQCCGSLDNLLQFRFLIWKSFPVRVPVLDPDLFTTVFQQKLEQNCLSNARSSIVSQKVVGSGSKSGSGMNYGSVCIKAKSCGSGSTKLPRWMLNWIKCSRSGVIGLT
jgi:hypothetical protein